MKRLLLPLLLLCPLAAPAVLAAPDGPGTLDRPRLDLTLEAGAGYKRADLDAEVEEGALYAAKGDAALTLNPFESARLRIRSFCEAEEGPKTRHFKEDLGLDLRLEASRRLRFTAEANGAVTLGEASSDGAFEVRGALSGELFLDGRLSSLDLGVLASREEFFDATPLDSRAALWAGWTQVAGFRRLLMVRAEMRLEYLAKPEGGGGMAATGLAFVHLDSGRGALLSAIAQYRRDETSQDRRHAVLFNLKVEIELWDELSLFAELAFDCWSKDLSGSYWREQGFLAGLILKT